MFHRFDMSVRRRLVLGLSVLAILTVCATVIAAVTFFSHREKLHQVVNNEVPTLLLAAELAHAGEAIASGVAPIALSASFLEAESITGEIVDKFSWMDRLIARIDQRGADPANVDLLREERANIYENFLQLQANVSTWWHVKSRNSQRRKRSLDLLKGQAVSAMDHVSSDKGHPASAWIEHSAALRLSQVLSARSNKEIRQAQLELSKLIEETARIAGTSQTAIDIDIHNRIRILTTTAADFLYDRTEEKELAKKTSDLVIYHKHLSDRLTAAIGNLLRQHKSAIELATSQAENALTVSSILLALLSILSIVLVAVVAILLDRGISGRLRKLQDSMQLVASGERIVDIPEDGKDEIGAMGRTLSTFIKTLNHQEHALRKARNEAVTANRAKSLFLANVSHELRTPLNAILGFSEIIRTGALGPPQPARYGTYANDIHESGLQLLELINDVVDMAKIEAGQTELNETAINVGNAIQNALSIVSQLAREAHITLDTNVPHTLPPLWADNRMLVQMCTNLIENAIDFSPPGSTVTISAEISDNGELNVVVADQGMGMSPSEITLALKPLEREDIDTTRETDGTGLGLPLIAQYINLHGGQLLIDSFPDEGTTVRITFPASRVRTSSERHFTVIEGKA